VSLSLGAAPSLELFRRKNDNDVVERDCNVLHGSSILAPTLVTRGVPPKGTALYFGHPVGAR